MCNLVESSSISSSSLSSLYHLYHHHHQHYHHHHHHRNCRHHHHHHHHHYHHHHHHHHYHFNRELEGVIRSLQDSITKRHPDSIANLIRAANMSDSVQLKRRQQDEQIEVLKNELGENYENNNNNTR